MDTIDSLIEEHATLRRLAREIEDAIGTQRDVGWDDCVSCEIAALRAAQQKFQDELRDHETREERVIDAMLRDRLTERAALESAIRRAHSSLNDMTALLRTISGVCDGTHMHAVRSMTKRLLDELESHLTHEENVLFPRMRRRIAARP